MQHLEAELEPRVIHQRVRQAPSNHSLLFPSSLEKGLGTQVLRASVSLQEGTIFVGRQACRQN